ncbi:MAG: hypothetical protein JF597_01560 [Streptomyces sp.]|uniref:hypothetical protein n=1 Tax=Streptomyces sp. TaxID=1931 RepID=UPI0025F6EA0A|nr:hypothetical protein [Streptomyces sp.]MBW8792316.1 hypothetical protein [Streptomyces sp.]
MADASRDDRNSRDLVLPAFEMDCRDWLVVSPAEAGLPEDVAGAPLLAVLSTVVIGADLEEATGALTVGMLDDDEDLEIREVAPGASAFELVEEFFTPGTRRYVMPAPGDHRLALLAEFVVGVGRDELDRRVDQLMQSFRWQLSA